ncbi:MAG: hypothetical protein LBK73_15415 [Treponema sp.]|nr:hypothetical protein [Treponema sp.]
MVYQTVKSLKKTVQITKTSPPPPPPYLSTLARSIHRLILYKHSLSLSLDATRRFLFAPVFHAPSFASRP